MQGGVDILAIPIIQNCILSIKQSYFLNNCTLAKLEGSLQRKILKQIVKSFGQSYFKYNLKNYRENNSRLNFGISNRQQNSGIITIDLQKVFHNTT